jgi:hypothetical protein
MLELPAFAATPLWRASVGKLCGSGGTVALQDAVDAFLSQDELASSTDGSTVPPSPAWCPAGAHGTVSMQTRPQARQASQRISASRYSRARPHDLTRVELRRARLDGTNLQDAQLRRTKLQASGSSTSTSRARSCGAPTMRAPTLRTRGRTRLRAGRKLGRACRGPVGIRPLLSRLSL